MNVRSLVNIAALSALLGGLSCVGGILVLLRVRDALSTTEIRLTSGITLLIFGVYWYHFANIRKLRERLEALEIHTDKPA